MKRRVEKRVKKREKKGVKKVQRQQERHQTLVKILVLPILFCIASFFLAVSFGSSETSLLDLLHGFFSSKDQETRDFASTILWSIRVPRTLIAAICGGALAGAGVISQGLFRNPLASPTILGTTSGGTLAASLTFYFSSDIMHWLSIPASAFLGALAATAFIFYLSKKQKNWNIENLLLTGFALGSLLSACTGLIISLSLEDYQKSAAAMHWMLGGFSSRGWEHIQISALPLAIGLLLAYKVASQLNILAFGEEVAGSLSINIGKLRQHSIISISLLVGTSVSIAGALPFIGLVVPHVTRRIYGPEHRTLLLTSIINGMTITMIADLFARTLRAPLELNVGVLTSLIGAPFFLWILLKGDRKNA